MAVDLREGSETYGKWFGVVLSAENKKQFFIPKGFAHGFLVLSEHAEFVYKCSDFYHPNDEGGLIWNDPDIGVEWPIPEGMELSFSDTDTNGEALKSTVNRRMSDCIQFFLYRWIFIRTDGLLQSLQRMISKQDMQVLIWELCGRLSSL